MPVPAVVAAIVEAVVEVVRALIELIQRLLEAESAVGDLDGEHFAAVHLIGRMR